MLKWVGILLILTGTGGLGLRMANELDLRIRELQTLQQIVLLLNGEIRHLHRPLPEAFRSAGERTGEPFRDFLLRTATDLEQRNGRSARLIWERNLKNCAGELHLTEPDLRALDELGGMLGCLDVKQQLGALAYYQENLNRALADAAEDAKNRKKLYRYLGILSGVAVVIFIL
ncbi:MAG: stage III sporulation protein AB [Lachnospiraceae bacterium]|nr:stage III sporulation protein AB [Lachnospiraceae bacterium]